MPKSDHVELGPGRDAVRIPILYEDRSVIAIDKPSGWMLVPFSWQRTNRNLQAAIASSIAAKDFWARSRNVKFLRYVHRLDTETSGVLLFAKSPGALKSYGDLFESRAMAKKYLAVVRGTPKQPEWISRLKLSPDPRRVGKMRADSRRGKEAETVFRALRSRVDGQLGDLTLVEARPVTGRTHQIRVHLAESGHPVVGDRLYGREDRRIPGAVKSTSAFPLALRAVALSYRDPFTGRRVEIRADTAVFLRAFSFDA